MESIVAKELNVLIIEDNAADRELLHLLLLKSALCVLDVQFADSLNKALQFLEEGRFDVVFLDLGLPDSQGIESVSTLSAGVPDIPIIVLSGFDDAEIGITAVQKGAEDYLVKWQFDGNLLARAVWYAIEHKRTRKMLSEKQKNINAIFDVVPVGMMLIDEHAIVKRVNNAIREMLNKDYQKIINQRFGDALGCINTVSSGRGCGNSRACELCRLHKAIDTILESRQSVNEVEIRPTFEIDGKRITRWFRISGGPAIVDGCIHAVIAINDITESKTAEDIVKLQAEIMRNMLEGVILARTSDSVIVYTNPNFEEMFGYSPGELIGKNISMINAPTDEKSPEAIMRDIQESLRENGVWRGEVLNVRKDGTTFWCYANISIFNHPDYGEVWVATHTDITERKLAGKALLESEERFQHVAESAGDWIWEVDVEGLYTYSSPVAEKVLGYKPEEIVGNKYFYDFFAPHEKEELKKAAFKVFAKRESFKGFTNSNVRKDGSIAILETHGTPVTDDKGNLCGYRGADRDITEQKKAERERRLAEDKYRTIFENSAVAISMVDEQERLISWNKFTEDLLGMDKEDLYLKPVKSLYPEEQWRKMRSHNIRQKGMQHHLETQVLRKNGELIDVDISLSVLKDPEGKVIGSIGVIRDVTERKKAERDLKELVEVKSQFISTVSHELRTPLSSMKEAVTIVSDEMAGEINEEQRNFLNIAKRNAERLSRLIDEFLDFQKLSANKMRFDIQDNNVKEVIEDAYNTMAPYAKKKKVHLFTDIDGNLPKARLDSDRIIQVLTNLISNAIKFTPENGQVSVKAQRQGEDLAIRISDTGMGIPEEDLPKIFEQFYRVNNPKQKVKGTGLGLAIVRKIIEAHNARIEVESQISKGTTFTIFLPLSTEMAPESDRQQSVSKEKVPGLQ